MVEPQCLGSEFCALATMADDPRLSAESPSLESQQHRPDSGWRSLGRSNPRRMIMAMQIVMDRTGDSRHHFDPNDAQGVAKAERRFYELTKLGFTAAARPGPGQVSQIRSFDPNAEEPVFFPRLLPCSSPPALPPFGGSLLP